MLDHGVTLLKGAAALLACCSSGFVCLCVCDPAGLGRCGSGVASSRHLAHAVCARRPRSRVLFWPRPTPARHRRCCGLDQRCGRELLQARQQWQPGRRCRYASVQARSDRRGQSRTLCRAQPAPGRMLRPSRRRHRPPSQWPSPEVRSRLAWAHAGPTQEARTWGRTGLPPPGP